MPVSIVPNRLALTAWRAILNTWAAAINVLQTSSSTNTSNIATNTNNIATNTSNISTNASNISSLTTATGTNTSNIATNTADILLRQIATSRSTLLYPYKAITASYSMLGAADINSITNMTNTGAASFTIPLGALNALTIGHFFIMRNDPLSTNLISIVVTGGVALSGSANIPIGQSAYFVKVSATDVIRIF